MLNKFYLPILKSKLGEFTALSKLSSEIKNHIVPLFEITPLEWDQVERKKPRTLDEHLDSFCKKFLKWNSSDCFIDTALLNWANIDNSPKIEDVFDKLSNQDHIPIPIIYISSSPAFIAAFKNIIRKFSIKDIGLRVTPNDVTSPQFSSYITNILGEIDIPAKRAHLIFDLKESNFSDPDAISDSILGVLESFPFLADWKSFTIAGTAFPPSSLIKEGTSRFKRNDWKFYICLIEKLISEKYYRLINFGDYSIVAPEYFEFNPKIMKASANIRYTHDDEWIVAKGTALKKATDYMQYKKLANDIYKSGLFLGTSFSEGDEHLLKCSRGEEKPGAPSVWNWVGNNHHFTKVVFDLFANSSAA